MENQSLEKWVNKVHSKKCLICGKMFKIFPHEKDERKTCSLKCKYQYHSIVMKGKIAGMLGKHHSALTIQKYKKIRNTAEWIAKTHTPERNLKLALALTGQKNHCWKHGQSSVIRQLKKVVRKLSPYKTWRKKVFERDKFMCQKCGQIGGKLEAHHIKPYIVIVRENNLRTIAEIHRCTALWDITNGQTLCIKCHNETKKKLKRVY